MSLNFLDIHLFDSFWNGSDARTLWRALMRRYHKWCKFINLIFSISKTRVWMWTCIKDLLKAYFWGFLGLINGNLICWELKIFRTSKILYFQKNYIRFPQVPCSPTSERCRVKIFLILSYTSSLTYGSLMLTTIRLGSLDKCEKQDFGLKFIWKKNSA